MPKDVIITPASGLVDFQGNTGISSATIQLDNNGNLNITNPSGDLTIGNADRDVYIGDGINNVDIVFEQSGEIRALTNKTISLGQADSYIRFAGQLLGEIDITQGPLLVGAATSTGTASQPLQVTGGAYVSGSVGIGTTNPGSGVQLDVVSTTNESIRARNSTISSGYLFFGVSPSDYGRIGYYNGSWKNIAINEGGGNLGVGITNPSDKLHVLGGKIRVDSTTGGLEFWSGAGFFGGVILDGSTNIVLRADATRSLIFHTGGANDRGRIDSSGTFLVGTASSTGTASQRLQVTGGASFTGTGSNVGIGTTNPTSKLSVVGDVSVSGITTASRFVSNIATGTAPLSVASTTVVTNLNADLLDGLNSDAFARDYNAAAYTDVFPENGFITYYNVAGAPDGSIFGTAINVVLDDDGKYGSQIWAPGQGGFAPNLYIRKKDNDVYGSWAKVWHSANDGAGSGLDADLLDNIDSTSFLRSDISQQGGKTYVTHDFNTYPSLYDVTFVNPTGSSNLPTGMTGVMSYRFIMGAGDTSGRGFDLVGAAESSGNLYIRERSIGTWSKLWHNNNDGAGSGLDADLLAGISSTTYSASLRANRNISGGGTITVDASYNVLWSSRFIIISNGSGSNFSTSGYFDIDCPLSGTITGVGGAGNVTATAAGIPLGALQAIYYILPIGSGATSLAANFRVAQYTSALDIPHNWVLICVRNGDNGAVTFNNGITLSNGQSLNSIQQATANTANTLVRRDGSGNFSAGSITITGLNGNGIGGSSGNYFTKVPVVASDGVMEVGRFIDFHNTSGDTTDFTYRLDNGSNGVLACSGSLLATQFTSLSDVNKKKNIRPIENAIDITKKLEGVRFDWIDNDTPSIGVIAQQVEKVLPELVVENDGIKSVSYGNIVGVLIEAIKEQQIRIEELERKINA